MNNITVSLERFFVKKAPSLPKNIKEVIVTLAPWLEIVGVVMTLPALMALVGFNALMYGTPYGGYYTARAGYNFSLASIFLIAGLILMVLAIP